MLSNSGQLTQYMELNNSLTWDWKPEKLRQIKWKAFKNAVCLMIFLKAAGVKGFSFYLTEITLVSLNISMLSQYVFSFLPREIKSWLTCTDFMKTLSICIFKIFPLIMMVYVN